MGQTRGGASLVTWPPSGVRGPQNIEESLTLGLSLEVTTAAQLAVQETLALAISAGLTSSSILAASETLSLALEVDETLVTKADVVEAITLALTNLDMGAKRVFEETLVIGIGVELGVIDGSGNIRPGAFRPDTVKGQPGGFRPASSSGTPGGFKPATKTGTPGGFKPKQ